MVSPVLLNMVQLSASDFIHGYQPELMREHGLNWELIQSAVYRALNWNLKCTDTGLSGGFERNFPATNIVNFWTKCFRYVRCFNAQRYNLRKAIDELKSFPNTRNVYEKSLKKNFLSPFRTRQDNFKNLNDSSCNSFVFFGGGGTDNPVWDFW